MQAHTISVSIITPCYNGAPFLRATIESALAQTRPPLEVIVIDDGSTDESAKIAETFGPPVRVLRQPNQGESVARNRGIDASLGSHLAFLDADDLLAPEALERLAGAIEGRPDAVALMGCAWFEDDPTRPYKTKVPTFVRFYPEIIQSNLMPPHCWLAPKRAVVDAGGFLSSLQWFEDWDLWWRVGLEPVTLQPVPYLGALYRRHASSQLATTKLSDRARGHARLMERMATAILERPDILALHGGQLFWSCWAALSIARSRSVPWRELRGLAASIQRVARHSPPGIARSRFARTVSWLGPRLASPLGPRAMVADAAR